MPVRGRNDLRFMRETVGLLETAGIAVWVFGGWAEELLGLAAPRPHQDLDLIYPAGSFALLDAVLMAGCGLAKITARRLPHERAFTRQSVMIELILVQPASPRSSGTGSRCSWSGRVVRHDRPRPASPDRTRLVSDAGRTVSPPWK